MATTALDAKAATRPAPTAVGRRLLSVLDGPPPDATRLARADRRRRFPRASREGNRHRYMQEVSSVADLEENRRINRKVNRNLAIAIGSLVAAGAGATIWAPFTALSVLGIVYVSAHTAREGWDHWQKQRQIGVAALSTLVKILLLAQLQFVMCAFTVIIYAFNRKMIKAVRDHSTRNMIDVFRQTPREVWILHGEVELQVPLESVTTDDVVVVHAGEMIPVDGRVVRGSGTVDQHALNGESQPADKDVGDEVLALTMVLSGRLYIQTERTGEHTSAAQIAQILQSTVGTKTETQLWAESLADRTVLPTILTGLAVWPYAGALNVATLLYSHPNFRVTLCGSVAMLNGLNIASHNGILVKDGRSMELLEKVDAVAFDKTGTLTTTEPRVGLIHCVAPQWDATRLLRLAAAAEYKQSHPIARAIRSEAERSGLAVPPVEHTDLHVGHGLMARVEGREVRLGSASFIKKTGRKVPKRLREVQQRCLDEGKPLVMVAVDEEVVGAIELHINVRPEAKAVIAGLRRRGVKEIVIISGDHETPTRLLAEELGVDRWFAATLPEQKAERISELQREGRTVCYVGDGINDAVALRQADVSISLRGASSVAMDAAGVVLMDGTLSHLEGLFDLSAAVQRNIRRTFTIVVVPHVIAAVGAGLALYQGMVPAIVLTVSGLLAGIYNGARPFIKLPPPAAIKAEDAPPAIPACPIAANDPVVTPEPQAEPFSAALRQAR